MKNHVRLWSIALVLFSFSSFGQFNAVFPIYDEDQQSWTFIDTAGQSYNNLWLDTLAYTGNKVKRSDYRYYTIEKDGQVGLMRETGEQMLEMEYQNISSITPHLFHVSRDDKVGVFSGKGARLLVPVEYDKVKLNTFNNCVLQKGNTCYLCIVDSSRISDVGFDTIRQLNEEYYIGQKGNKWGLFSVEDSHQWIANCDSIRLFEEEYFLYYQNGKVGLVNEFLKIPSIYSSIQYINSYYAIGRYKNKYHLLSFKDGSVRIDDFKKGYSVLQGHFFKYAEDSLFYLLNNQNKPVLTGRFTAINSFSSNFILMTNEQGTTIIDTKENIIIEGVQNIEKGENSTLSKYQKNNVWGAISNQTRSVVINHQYASLSINRRLVKAYTNDGVVDIYTFDKAGRQSDLFKVRQEKYGSIHIKKMNPIENTSQGKRGGPRLRYSIEKEADNTYQLYDSKSNKLNFITHKIRHFYDRVFVHEVDSIWTNNKVLANVTVNSGKANQWTFITKRGNLSQMERYPKCIYDTIFKADPFHYFVKRNQRYGLTDLKSMKFATDFDTIILQQNGLAICKKSASVSDIMNENGELISDYSFFETGTFQEGVLQVHTPFGWNYINEEGKAILDKFHKEKMYHRGKYMAQRYDRRYELMKYNKKSDTFIPYFKETKANRDKKYDSLAPMSASKFWVYKKNKLYGAINPSSGRVISAQYKKPFQFDENGLAIVKVNRVYGVMNTSLRYKLPLQYTRLEQMNYQDFLRYSIAGKGRLVGISTKSGKTITSNKYQYISDIFNEIAVFKRDGLYGVLNTKGKEILPPQFTKVMRPSQGAFPVLKEGKWGLVSQSGEWLLPPTYKKVELYREGLWFGSNNLKGQYFDASGKQYDYRPKEPQKVVPVKKKKEPKTKLTKVEQNDKLGLQNQNGEWVVFPVYDSLVYHRQSQTWEGFRPAQYNLQKGEKCKFPREFEHILHMGKQIYKVESNGLWGYYNVVKKVWVYPFSKHEKKPVVLF